MKIAEISPRIINIPSIILTNFTKLNCCSLSYSFYISTIIYCASPLQKSLNFVYIVFIISNSSGPFPFLFFLKSPISLINFYQLVIILLKFDSSSFYSFKVLILSKEQSSMNNIVQKIKGNIDLIISKLSPIVQFSGKRLFNLSNLS